MKSKNISSYNNYITKVTRHSQLHHNLIAACQLAAHLTNYPQTSILPLSNYHTINIT